MRIIGLDPGLVRTGWGIIDVVGNRYTHVAHGVIAPHVQLSLSKRLALIYGGVLKVLEEYSPDEAAIEETFLNTNAASTLKLGHARAAAMLPPAKAGMEVAEYAAKVIKKALVGTGNAEKSQVAFMVRRILSAPAITSTDATDALAVAITHANHLGPVRSNTRS
jgi:crossover junction endodeoxyribonuclease RuvC